MTRLAVGIVLTGWAAAGFTDTDIWGHVRFGLDFLASGHLPWRDPYSFTSDQAWINHEWLWDVLVGAVYQFGGLTGLLVFRAALVAAFLVVVDRATRRAPAWARVVTLLAVTLASVGQWTSTRPQLATLLLYAITLSSPDAMGLPGLFALWANLHGGWIMGFGALVVRAVLRPARRRVLLVVACGLATLLNPYGVRLWIAIADAIHRGWADVTEWAPIWWLSTGSAPLFLWVALVLVAAGLSFVVAADRPAWIWTGLSLLAAARSRRLLALAAITIVAELMPRWRAAGLVHRASIDRRVLLAGIAPVGIACWAARLVARAGPNVLPAGGRTTRPRSRRDHLYSGSEHSGTSADLLRLRGVCDLACRRSSQPFDRQPPRDRVLGRGRSGTSPLLSRARPRVSGAPERGCRLGAARLSHDRAARGSGLGSTICGASLGHPAAAAGSTGHRARFIRLAMFPESVAIAGRRAT